MYQKYEDQFMHVFAQYSGRLLSTDEEPTVLEGEWLATRSVLIEFNSKKEAYSWMLSEEYQAISKFREGASSANSILVKGL